MDVWESCYRKAQLAASRGQYDAAIDAYRAAISANSTLPFLFNLLGYAELTCEKWIDAITAFDETLRLDPNCANAYLGLGHALIGLGRFTEAEFAFRKSLDIEPSVNGYVALGATLSAQNHRQEAEECFRHAINLEPSFEEAHYNLGLVLASQGRHDEALPEYRRSIELDPGYAIAHHELGLAYERVGELEKAERHLQRAIELRNAGGKRNRPKMPEQNTCQEPFSCSE